MERHGEGTNGILCYERVFNVGKCMVSSCLENVYEPCCFVYRNLFRITRCSEALTHTSLLIEFYTELNSVFLLFFPPFRASIPEPPGGTDLAERSKAVSQKEPSVVSGMYPCDISYYILLRAVVCL